MFQIIADTTAYFIIFSGVTTVVWAIYGIYGMFVFQKGDSRLIPFQFEFICSVNFQNFFLYIFCEFRIKKD
jgi:hypothetical protein